MIFTTYKDALAYIRTLATVESITAIKTGIKVVGK